MARRPRRWRILLVLALAVGALLFAVTSAPGGGRGAPKPQSLAVRDSVQIQAVFDRAGNPSLIANSGAAGPTPQWSICSPAPASACRALPRTKRAILNPGHEPAGTVFVATDTAGGHTYGARVTWRGRVSALAPPRVAGTPRFGAHVTAVAGRWMGGWGSEFDQLGVEACQTRRGTECVVLSGGQYGCPGQPSGATVGGWLPGMYLFAFDLRVPRDGACAGVGYSYPGAVPPWPVSQIATRSVPVGPVTGPPRPVVTILRSARFHAGRVLVASVRCSTPCHVWTSVLDRRPGSGSLGRATVTGSATVGVLRRGIEPGTLSVELHVDDGPQISGESHLLP
ncbi:MAG TPA: hypothetical protein VMJ65_08930 [Solirubrobacteraceae bacterium]|nr:hypothetical protein [Solirubrobacteraceae bacterium]